MQSLGKRRLLHKIRNKQSRRTKNENHVVSKQIVDCAAKHRRCIVLEKLEHVRKGKIRRYIEQSQWSFYQLLQFILYKAALRGVMVIEADPAYTSQECSRCEIGSGRNGHRPKLIGLLRDPRIGAIVVEHRDRLARLGSEYIEAALQSTGRKVVVVDEKEMKDDLVQDMIEVLTSFCARRYGRRFAKNKAKKAMEAIEDE